MSTQEPVEPSPEQGGKVLALIDLDLGTYLALPAVRVHPYASPADRPRDWQRARVAMVAPDVFERYERIAREWIAIQEELRNAQFNPQWEGKHRI